MMKKKIKTENEEGKLNIMVMFQGVKGEEKFDTIQKKIRRVNFSNPMKYYHSIGSGSTFDRVKKEIEECDAAIAIVTPDFRIATKGGNLWLEIGLFLGIRNNDLIYLFIDNELKDEYGNVGIISDLKPDYCDFGSDKDLTEKIKVIIRQLENDIEKQKNKINEVKKNKIVISFRSPFWNINDSYKCPDRNSICNRRLNHLSFSSELIGINIEMELILVYKSLFSQLSKIAAELKYYVPEDIEVYLKTKVTKDSLENTAYDDKEKIGLIEIMTNNDKIEKGFFKTLDEVNLAYTDFLEKSEILFSIGEYKLLGYNNEDKSYSSLSSDNSNETKLKHRALYFNERIKYIKLKEELNSTVDDLFRILELDCVIRKSKMGEYESNYFNIASILLDNYKILMDVEIILKNWEKVITLFKRWYESISDLATIDNPNNFYLKLNDAEKSFPHNTSLNEKKYVPIWEEKIFMQ